MRVLVVDNYDSFVYNLVHYLEEMDCEVTVQRNDDISLDEVEEYDKILLSPGPGIPNEAGLLKEIIKKYAPYKSILGVCLGHQAIVEVFGGKIVNLNEVYHGISTPIKVVQKDILYQNVPETLQVGRYHSWVASPELPKDLEVTAIDEQGQVMSLKHKKYDLYGVQYHPESVLTPYGKEILKNWVESSC